MENNYEITEKQLVFLNKFLLNKYPGISDDSRIELIDHLISDFEATTKNGNLSQYLSNELGFIRKFLFTRANKIKEGYGRQTWKKFFSFFTDYKLLPISVSIILLFYFLSDTLNNRVFFLVLIISNTIIFFTSIYFGRINKKSFKKLDEVKYLGTEIWLPFLLIQLLGAKEVLEFIMSYSLLASIYSSFAIIYGLATFIVLRKQKKIILEKYKHLLN